MAKHEYQGNPDSFKHLWEDGYEFKLSEYIDRGWKLFKENSSNFVVFALIYSLAGAAFEVLGVNDAIGGIFQFMIGAPLTAGFYIVADKIARKEPTEFGDFFKGFDHFVQLILGNLTYGFLVVLGMVLLFFPGIYLAVAFAIWVPFVIFEDLNFWDALQTSRKVVTKNWWNFLLLMLVLGGIALLGILALVVGIFVAIPVIHCIAYAVYEDIVARKSSSYQDKIDEIGIEVEEITDFDDV
ncbi:MAG: hypothetical protein AAGA10_10400 [Bacteroidota bacterium]